MWTYTCLIVHQEGLDWSCLDCSLPDRVEMPGLIIHGLKVWWCSSVLWYGYCAIRHVLPLSNTKQPQGGVGEILDVLLICLLVLLNKSSCGSPAAYKGAGFPSSIKKYRTEILLLIDWHLSLLIAFWHPDSLLLCHLSLEFCAWARRWGGGKNVCYHLE